MAKSAHFKMTRGVMEQLLISPGVAANLALRAQAIKSTAERTAPRASGTLAASHRVEVDISGGRARARVIADTPYAAKVAADSGYLGNALSAGR